ncbi:hypothetical protein DEO72_LG8g1507 [Vigna unguiculata]|uniref:Uncharacterized protein n=1 Tax=Vigna unguiculata TaxID=3917 RepID=A0A4D6MPZ7_VIGUN|nr:hypothetical protein DEO72_LG8g1507 [Vigna unguiculata]
MDAARGNTSDHSDSSQINGTLRVQPNDQLPLDNIGYSQLSSPSTRFPHTKVMLRKEDEQIQAARKNLKRKRKKVAEGKY